MVYQMFRTPGPGSPSPFLGEVRGVEHLRSRRRGADLPEHPRGRLRDGHRRAAIAGKTKLGAAKERGRREGGVVASDSQQA